MFASKPLPTRIQLTSYLSQAQAPFLQATGDPVATHQMAWQSLENLREQQASSLAYFDTFLFFAAVGVALVFLVPFMRRSVVQKGVHVAAE